MDVIEQGQADIADLISKLRSLGLTEVRLLVHQAGGEPSLVTAVVNAGLDVAGVTNETYDYGDVALARAVLDGNDVADWLASGKGKVDGLTFVVPEPSPNCSWIHSGSRSNARYGTLLAPPHTEHHVLAAERPVLHFPYEVLAGAGLPLFPDPYVATASVLFDVHSVPGGPTVPSEMMIVRLAHLDAYLEKVEVSPSSITASVLGGNLNDVYLQVSSAGHQHETRVGTPGPIRVPVSGADTTDTWVALTRGQECLDFRTISSRWSDSNQHRDLVYEPEDLSERLDLMRRNGENETVEFKEAIPKGDGIPRAVAAFANGDGGTIVVGIEDGTGEVTGVEDAATCRDTLVDIVRNRVRPSPPMQLFTCTLQGRAVIAMRVEPGDDRPYGVTGKGGRRYYVRRGATNRVAEPEEMRAISLSRKTNRQEQFPRVE